MEVVVAVVIRAAVVATAMVGIKASHILAAVSKVAVVATTRLKSARISTWATVSTEISAPMLMEIRNSESQQSEVEAAPNRTTGFPSAVPQMEASLPLCLKHLSMCLSQ